MTEANIIDQLTKNHGVFSTLLSDVTPEFIDWRPAENKWSLLEIVCHLHDEEREDFRARIQHCFDAPNEALPPIDPVGWVVSRKYVDQDYLKMASAFIQERQKSIEWLRNLDQPNWEHGCDHQHFGRMSAHMLLSNWLAHDYIHIRQINRNHFLYLKQSSDVKLDYAGDW